MRHSVILSLLSTVVVSGCSETATPSVTPEQIPSLPSEPPPAAMKTSPQYEAVIAVYAAPKRENGPSCAGDMSSKGQMRCGPETSLTELSWEFTEHRDGTDDYEFQWTLTANGETQNGKGLTVGFNGVDEAVVVDAKHYIVIRKGPLNATGAADK